MKFLYQYITLGVCITCNLFMPEKLVAQLYAEVDNRVKVEVPGIPASMLQVTITGGTIKQAAPYRNRSSIRYNYKEDNSSYWIVRPSWVLREYGQRPEVVLTVSANINGKTKILATKKYVVKTALYLDIRKKKHILTPEDLLNEDIILINNDRGNMFDLILYAPNGEKVTSTVKYYHPEGRFFDKERQVMQEMKKGSSMYIKFPGYTDTIELVMGE